MDTNNRHEHAETRNSDSLKYQILTESARTHESPCLIAEGKFDARCTCEGEQQWAMFASKLSDLIRATRQSQAKERSEI